IEMRISTYKGPTEAEVTQTPRHLITETKKQLTVTCSQNMDHELMYWYRQDPGLGLKLIYYSINVDHFEKGEVSDGYKVSRTEKGNFPLTLESANISQTSLYLCASSSRSTALHNHILSAQKRQVPERQISLTASGTAHRCTG
uniref:Ig-like domain-containing protein n=1 Tax=Myotis lucifugus TaxID=59463 RepID=G1Q7Z1_MYOLU